MMHSLLAVPLAFATSGAQEGLPPSNAQTIEALVQCGVSRSAINIQYQDELQSDEITISDLGSITEDKLRCVRAAINPQYLLTLQSDAQRAAFDEFSERENRPLELASAIEWLSARGLKDRVPIYSADTGLEPFARAVESACGLDRGEALAGDGNVLTIKAGFLRGLNPAALDETLPCILNVFMASNAFDHGIEFGFVGNDASSRSDTH